MLNTFLNCWLPQQKWFVNVNTFLIKRLDILWYTSIQNSLLISIDDDFTNEIFFIETLLLLSSCYNLPSFVAWFDFISSFAWKRSTEIHSMCWTTLWNSYIHSMKKMNNQCLQVFFWILFACSLNTISIGGTCFFVCQIFNSWSMKNNRHYLVN